MRAFFISFTHIVSKNHTKTCWVLKCDIRKFFENINHDILIDILKKYVVDKNIICLLEKVIRSFHLKEKLNIGLPPDKIFIKTLASGIDFLGWVHFPDHRVLRTTTKRRIFRILGKSKNFETLNSYLGLLKHGNTKTIQGKILTSNPT
ncbi:MAG: hypothetical protein AAB584_00070 [Patescibacteria group bacterium]